MFKVAIEKDASPKEGNLTRWLQENPMFNKKYAGVWFEPFVTKQDSVRADSYDELGLVSFLRQICNQFERILIPHLRSQIYGITLTSIQYIPATVAKLNE